VHEGSKKTAKRFGKNVYEVNFGWQRWCRHLERMPEEHRREVFTLAQASPEHAMSKFGYTKAEVLRICWHWKECLAAGVKEADAVKATRSALLDAAKRLFKQYAPVRSLTGSVYEDVSLYIACALEDVNDDTWESGRFPGEFTARELSFGKRRSHYKWVYDTLTTMRQDHVRICFPKAGEDFLRACKLTRKGRLQRRREHLRDPGAQQQTKIEKKRKRSLVTPGKSNYLPKPAVSPRVIAKSFADYSALLSTC
jgi:hypothetical protein